MKTKLTYQEAIDELETIVATLEGDDVSVDALSSKLARASVLIGICQQALYTTEAEVKKFLEEIHQGKGADNQ